jgi:hypothetical protein
MRLIAAVLAIPLGCGLVLAGWPIEMPPPEPIPSKSSAVATPVHFPTMPPIRSTPMFVSTAETPISLSDWHRDTLIRWSMPERADVSRGMN